jgi:hypothetical protein
MSHKLVYRKRLEAHKLLFGRIFDVDTADFRKRDICGAGRRQFPAAPLRHLRSSSTSRVAQDEPEVQPDGVLDEYRGKATAAVRDIGYAKGYRRLSCPTSSLSDNALRDTMESRFAAKRRPAMRGPAPWNVASPTTNLPTTGPVYRGPGYYPPHTSQHGTAE